MRKAGQASGRAFTEAMRQAWILEKDLTAYLEYMFKRKGCETSAYVPVVAGGKVLALVRNSGRRYTDLEQNASQIHYVRNDDVLIDGDLVLADAGGVRSPILTNCPSPHIHTASTDPNSSAPDRNTATISPISPAPGLSTAHSPLPRKTFTTPSSPPNEPASPYAAPRRQTRSTKSTRSRNRRSKTACRAWDSTCPGTYVPLS